MLLLGSLTILSSVETYILLCMVVVEIAEPYIVYYFCLLLFRESKVVEFRFHVKEEDGKLTPIFVDEALV